MHWLILIVAGLLEIGWAVGLKYTEGFSRLWPTVGTVLAMVLSIFLLGVAMRALPMGVAYAVWVGIGIVGTTVIGMLFLGEPAHVIKVVCVLLIIVGIAGLKMSTTAS
ncbi:quaternary ammonium compound efflux SMR transporter SugE [Ruficoccus sp. ZRK36]|uniref:DMT family transporter n=1 Tax=Ruficoccus sp. ZRK36 TaxID=2866311 RepID=UPI001C72EF7E|nr:quaternary ammonium compound efflux SMR transporter SugE [Ruficoccus sp. ZRK36]